MEHMSDGRELIADIMFQLSGVPEDVAQRALAHAIGTAAESCPLTPELFIPTQNRVAEYPFDCYLPKDYEVLSVQYVKYCGICLDPIDKCDPCPHGYFMDDLSHLTLYPAATRDAAKDLEVCVSVRPALTACEYPLDLIRRCRDGLIHQMKGYLMQMPDKQWSNNPLAAFHLQQAKSDFADLTSLVARNFTKGTTVATGECWL